MGHSRCRGPRASAGRSLYGCARASEHTGAEDPEELLFAPDEFVLLMVQALAGEASTLAAACAALDVSAFGGI